MKCFESKTAKSSSRSSSRSSTKRFLILMIIPMGFLLNNCGGKSGSGSRETQPDFDSRSSVFSPGRGNVEYFQNCFNLPVGDIAEFVGWMAAKLNLESLSNVCRGLNQAGFAEGISLTKEPVDIN